MCERNAVPSRAMIAGALLLGALSAQSVRAQAAQQSTAQLRARIASAARVSSAAKDSMEVYRLKRIKEMPNDSVTAGAVRLRYDARNLGSSLEPIVRNAAEKARVITDATFGDAARTATADAAPIIVTRVHHTYAPLVSVEYMVVELADRGGRSTGIRQPLTEKKIVDAIVDVIGTLATNRIPKSVNEWVGYWAPARLANDEYWKNAALDLATSPSAVTRACYAGSVMGCESALGLLPVHDRLTEWYTSEGWHVLVSEWAPPKTDVALVAAHTECVEGHVASTCERLARTRPIPQPLNMSTRSTFFSFAVERGGKSAYAKILAGTGTPFEVFSAASGMPPDELVKEWRARVMASVPHADMASPKEAVVAIGWALIFGFAATRRRP